MRLLAWLVCTAWAIVLLSGCSGGGAGPGTPLAPPPDDEPLHVGPLLIQTAAVSDLRVETIPSTGGASFVALHGATIDYAAVQEMLDRVVFSSFRDFNWDIWVCDLFGDNLHKVGGTGHPDRHPDWSPDGTRIAFAQERDVAGEADVYVMNPDGTGLTNLTNSTDYDTHPTWSPTSDRIAFETGRDGNWEIYAMYADGSGPVNLTNHSGVDGGPDWCTNRAEGGIAWHTDRDGNLEIYKMDHRGLNPTRLTNTSASESYPAWSPNSYLIAFRIFPTNSDIFEIVSDGTLRGPIADSEHYEDYPCYSSDGRFVAFESDRGGGFNIWLRQMAPPYRLYRVTDSGGSDGYPDLGSPTMQTARVLIGPPNADHGHDPIWSYAYAAVAAFNAEGYLNFVRVGVRPGDVSTLRVTPLSDTGNQLAAVRLKCNEIVNLREDAGPGVDPVRWELDDQDATNAVLYFDANAGKLASVLLTRDTSYPAAAGASDLGHRLSGGRLQVTGYFAAVYDDTGSLVAEDVGTVEFEGARLVRAF